MKSNSLMKIRTSLARQGPCFAALWILVVGAAPLWAQSPSVTFRGLALEGRVEGIYFDSAQGKPQEFRASDYVRSGFCQASRTEPLKFYRIVPPKREGDPPTREAVGQAVWPQGDGPFLILVSRSGDKYGFSVAPDDEGSFPMGSFRVINASSTRVQVKAGERKEILLPQGTATLKPEAPEEGKGILFQVTADFSPPQLVYSNIWSGSQTTRTLVFILNRAHPRYPVGVKRLHESDLVMKAQRKKEEEGGR